MGGEVKRSEEIEPVVQYIVVDSPGASPNMLLYMHSLTVIVITKGVRNE